MRIFVTGASGFIGSATVPDLIAHGHEVIGLARTDEAARKITAAGAQPLRGSLEDLGALREGASAADGVIHLGFIHDFTRFMDSVRVDAAAIDTIGSALAGTNKPLVIASGMLGLAQGRKTTERDKPTAENPRIANATAVLALADRGVRSAVLRLPPTVHGEGDHGFIPFIIGLARAEGVSPYIGDGANHWSAVHVKDAASCFRLALEKAPAGSTLHAVDDEGVPTRTIAEIIGEHLNVPVTSVAPENAAEHFEWMARFFSMDALTSSAITRELIGWKPTHTKLVPDLEAGHYFASTPVH